MLINYPGDAATLDCKFNLSYINESNLLLIKVCSQTELPLSNFLQLYLFISYYHTFGEPKVCVVRLAKELCLAANVFAPL